MTAIPNKTFDELQPGDSASTQRVLQARDLRAWTAAFGGSGQSAEDGNVENVAGIVSVLMTTLVGSALPGPGSSIRSTAVQVLSVIPVDVLLTIQLVVREKRSDQGSVILTGYCSEPGGKTVATAVLEVVAPAVRLYRETAAHCLDDLLERCRGLKPMVTAVVHPCSAESLAGALEAAQSGLIVPVLFAPEAHLRHIAAAARLDLAEWRVVTSDGPEDSARKAALAAGSGEVQAVMKGSLHTDVLLHAMMQKESNLLTGRLLSHCFLVSVPTYARRIIVTDAALNIAPDTDQKRQICQNAIGFARALGVESPKVAVLAAVATVHTKMPASLDGAILAKMADRGQILGGIVDGPLDLDAAVDPTAAAIKGIRSPVAGAADVLLVPNIEAGNMVYKSLTFMADAAIAGLVVGARIPVMLTSRADTATARRASAAAALLYAEAVARDPTIIQPESAD